MKARLILRAAAALEQDPKKPWAVIKLGTYQGSLGPKIHVTEQRLQELAKSYDPAVERAAINFDHERSGPAHGSLRDPFVKDGVLYAYPQDLSDEARDQVKTRKRFRQSAEIALKHPVTGGWYLEGFALLGAAKSAVKGLPEVELDAGDSDAELVLLEEEAEQSHDPGAPAPSTAPQGEEEQSMTTPKTQTPPAAAGDGSQPTPPATPPATPPKTPPATPPATTPVNLTPEQQTALASLTEQSAALARERAEHRRERAELRVEKDLNALGTRLTPGMRRAGIATALILLASAEQPATVEFTTGEGAAATKETKPLYDVVLATLAAMPAFAAAGAGEMARTDLGAPLAGDRRSDQQRELDRKRGIKDEDAVALQQKHPAFFAADRN